MIRTLSFHSTQLHSTQLNSSHLIIIIILIDGLSHGEQLEAQPEPQQQQQQRQSQQQEQPEQQKQQQRRRFRLAGGGERDREREKAGQAQSGEETGTCRRPTQVSRVLLPQVLFESSFRHHTQLIVFFVFVFDTFNQRKGGYVRVVQEAQVQG